MNKAKITIPLLPYLADFCRHEFNTTDNEIRINTTHPIGMQIVSQIKKSGTIPKNNICQKNPVIFILPSCPYIHYENHFISISKWSEYKITQFIQAEFNLRVNTFFEIGYQKNYKQKQIIDAFLLAYNIKNNALSFDAIKKRDYRKRKSFVKNVLTEIENAII